MEISKAVKRQYVSSVQRAEAEIIYDEQSRAIVKYGLQIRTGTLAGSLKRGRFQVFETGTGSKLTMYYVAYMRYLDMKSQTVQRRKPYHIYNKIVFGRIYSKMYPKIMYGINKDIITELQSELNKQITIEL